MSSKSGPTTKVSVTTTQVPPSNQPDPLMYSENPTLTKQIGPPKQVPKSKQPIAEGRSSSNPKRAVLPKQSTSMPVTDPVAKKTTTGNVASKRVINDQTKPPAEDLNRWIVKEIEALKAVVTEHAVRLDKLEKGRHEGFTPPIEDDPGSFASLTEDDKSGLIRKPDPLGNLQEAMGLKNKKRLYNRCRANIAIAMLQAQVPLNVDWRNQHWSCVCKAAERARELEPQLGRYVDDWATYEIMKTIAKNKRSYNVKRVRGSHTSQTGKTYNNGDQAESSGHGDVSVRGGSSAASSHNGNSDNNENRGVNDLDMEDDDSCEVGDLEVQEDDDSEVCATEMQDDELLSDGGEGDKAGSQEVDNSEIGSIHINSEDGDGGKEKSLKMEIDDDAGMVGVGLIPAVDSRKDMAKKDLKRRLAKDSGLREDSGTTQDGKRMTKRKKN